MVMGALESLHHVDLPFIVANRLEDVYPARLHRGPHLVWMTASFVERAFLAFNARAVAHRPCLVISGKENLALEGRRDRGDFQQLSLEQDRGFEAVEYRLGLLPGRRARRAG